MARNTKYYLMKRIAKYLLTQQRPAYFLPKINTLANANLTVL